MDEKNIETIQKRMDEKDTDALCAIWIRNNRHEWTDEAFEAIRRILVSRQINPPKQTQPLESSQQSALSPMPQASSTQTSVFSFLKGIGEIGGILLILFLLTTPFMLMHWIDNRKKWNQEKTTLEQNRESLLRDFSGTNIAKRIAAVESLRHDKALIPTLVQGLEQNGNAKLALMYCNEGETHELLTAGIKWLQSHGFQVWEYRQTGGYARYFLKPAKENLNAEEANRGAKPIR